MEGNIIIIIMDSKFDYFVSKHYEFLQQLGFLFCVSAMLILLYLTIYGMEL